MAAAKPLAALVIALAAVPVAAGPIVAPGEGSQSRASAFVQQKAAAVDAPPVLPLFAGALALLGWRLGRRRRR